MKIDIADFINIKKGLESNKGSKITPEDQPTEMQLAIINSVQKVMGKEFAEDKQELFKKITNIVDILGERAQTATADSSKSTYKKWHDEILKNLSKLQSINGLTQDSFIALFDRWYMEEEPLPGVKQEMFKIDGKNNSEKFAKNLENWLDNYPEKFNSIKAKYFLDLINTNLTNIILKETISKPEII